MTSTQPLYTAAILIEVAQERARQNAKWGQQDCPFLHPDYDLNPAPPTLFYSLPSEPYAKEQCEQSMARGKRNWGDIITEEVSEAFTSARDPKRLREELVQCAAVIVAAIESLDRNGR